MVSNSFSATYSYVENKLSSEDISKEILVDSANIEVIIYPTNKIEINVNEKMELSSEQKIKLDDYMLKTTGLIYTEELVK